MYSGDSFAIDSKSLQSEVFIILFTSVLYAAILSKCIDNNVIAIMNDISIGVKLRRRRLLADKRINESIGPDIKIENSVITRKEVGSGGSIILLAHLFCILGMRYRLEI